VLHPVVRVQWGLRRRFFVLRSSGPVEKYEKPHRLLVWWIDVLACWFSFPMPQEEIQDQCVEKSYLGFDEAVIRARGDSQFRVRE
jgi:hypothetical protein